mgnify:CR=1 FL=1
MASYNEPCRDADRSHSHSLYGVDGRGMGGSETVEERKGRTFDFGLRINHVNPCLPCLSGCVSSLRAGRCHSLCAKETYILLARFVQYPPPPYLLSVSLL